MGVGVIEEYGGALVELGKANASSWINLESINAALWDIEHNLSSTLQLSINLHLANVENMHCKTKTTACHTFKKENVYMH